MFCVEGSAITSLCRPQRLIMGKLRHDKARGWVGVASFWLCRMHISSCTKHDVICHLLFLSNNTHRPIGGLKVRKAGFVT